ncbi:MAG TPA: ribonuclease P protein component [Hyphomicrobiaceae bacterium]|nr:ribonuclease P protein component [Hyphomicrobiaceae bacterium]
MDVAAGESTARCVTQRLMGRLVTPKLVTLKRRPEFLGVRAGGRWATPAFVLEGKRRSGATGAPVTAAHVAGGSEATGGATSAQTPRFGFTVSKKVGGAVERNRIKRRLKAAVRDVLLDHARADYDYVLVARRAALDAAYAALVADLVDAFKRVHARSERPERARASKG